MNAETEMAGADGLGGGETTGQRRERARSELEAANLYEANSDEDRENMIEAAVGLIGEHIEDSEGRRWDVEKVGVKDGWPTIGDGTNWDRAEQVEVKSKMRVYRYTAVIQVSAEDLEDANKQAEEAISACDGSADVGAWLEESEPEIEEQD